MDLSPARALLFDKDGTLFDFLKSWGGLGAHAIAHFAAGDAALAARLAEAGGYDLAQGRYRPESPMVSGSVEEVAAAWAALIANASAAEIEDWLNAAAEEVARGGLHAAAPDLPGLLDGFKAAGLALGVATNDAEAPARAQLAQVGALDRFDFVVGYDSGHGAKPLPGMILGFAAAMGVAPESVVMIGDSLHDVHAAKAAGALAAIGVLTGPASRAHLEAEADLVLESILDLPSALGL